MNDRLADLWNRLKPAVLLEIHRGEKRPVMQCWQNLTLAAMDHDYLAELDDCNVGVSLGKPSEGLCTIDIDSDEQFDLFAGLNPFLDHTLYSYGARGGNFWIRCRGQYPDAHKLKTQDGKAWGEWRSTGTQTVISGLHPSGQEYWENGGSPLVMDFSLIRWPKDLVLPWLHEPAKAAAWWSKPAKKATHEVARRAAQYVAKMPPAVSGEGGHETTFAVAVTLAHGFALNPDEAWPILVEYNERCLPPWTEKQLRHKLDDASALTRHPHGRGYLI